MAIRREKLEIIYSVSIIIAIPLLLVINTIYITRAVRAAYNTEIRQKADTLNTILAAALEQQIIKSDTTGLVTTLNAVEKAEPDVSALQVVKINTGDPIIIAHTDSAPSELNDSAKIQAKVVYERKQPVARLVATNSEGKTVQAWSVATPIIGSNNTVVAIVFSSVATAAAQAAIDSAFLQAFIVLLVSIIIIIVLLFRHFRLVGYIQLLAKQKELNQTMSDFLSVATHELKAPTTIMKGYIANVIDGTFGPISNDIKEQLTVALGQTDRLNSLVQDLLNVSRVEQGRVEYKYEPVDTTAVINTIVHNYAPIAREKGLELVFEPRTDIPAAKSDAGRVQEIFTNLIDNAVKYTPSGNVTVFQTNDGTMVKTTVNDTGLGMSKDAQKRLFQRFYRVKTEQTKNISGTGLGLWIIKQYIESMGGTITVASSEGQGTSFEVCLPINR